MEELLAIRHDEREFRRRWLARVEAWCKSLRENAGRGQGGKAPDVVASVLKELADIGEPEGSPLMRETRERLEAASREAAASGSAEGPEVRIVRNELSPPCT